MISSAHSHISSLHDIIEFIFIMNNFKQIAYPSVTIDVKKIPKNCFTKLFDEQDKLESLDIKFNDYITIECDRGLNKIRVNWGYEKHDSPNAIFPNGSVVNKTLIYLLNQDRMA
jgi:hypothetical protein